MPGGEQGWNMARVVAVLLGLDNVPGATITRYCSSSVQTTRMAMHAIRAGEGDVFISAGVECVSRFGIGGTDTPPVIGGGPEGSGREPVPGCAVRQRARPQPGAGAAPGRGVARPAGGRRTAGLLHQHGVDRGERRRVLRRHPGRSGRVRVAVPDVGRQGVGERVLGQGDHPDHLPGRHGDGRRRVPRARRPPWTGWPG